MWDVTCFPAALTAVSAWDPQVMYDFSKAQANEEFVKGIRCRNYNWNV